MEGKLTGVFFKVKVMFAYLNGAVQRQVGWEQKNQYMSERLNFLNLSFVSTVSLAVG